MNIIGNINPKFGGQEMKKLKGVLLVLGCIIVLAVIGGCLLDEITPTAAINPRSLNYAGIDANDVGILGITQIPSLADAKRVRTEIVVNHRTTQLNLKRFTEDDNLYYGDAYGFINASVAQGQYIQDLLIGDEGNPFSILGVLAAFGGVAVGRKYLKRPGDYTPQEHEVEVLKAKNGTA